MMQQCDWCGIVRQQFNQSMDNYWLSNLGITSKNIKYVIRQISLHQSEIQPQPQLLKISLYDNLIGDKGCLMLVKADWKHLQQLSLHNTGIGDEGCAHLAKGDWPKLQSIDIGANNISAKGCQNLMQANWNGLQRIYIDVRNIGELSYRILSARKWSWIWMGYLNRE